MKQYEIYLVNLDLTVGHEIKKTRPCVIISPDEMNKHIGTVIIAPMTTKSHKYPTRVEVKFMRKNGFIVLDQIRTVDKQRLIKKIKVLDESKIAEIKNVIMEMLVN
jgi:mRNA interferase MazF